MAYIDLGMDEGQKPGITGLLAYRPETGRALSAFAEVLLRGESPLTRGERELIAAYVSSRNECQFCMRSHAAVASRQVDGGRPLVDAVIADLDGAPVGEKLRALLRVAGAVQQTGRAVTGELVAAAREAGATDVEIHDAVLVAAAFSMFNRYVDGLGTYAPAEQELYDAAGEILTDHGYLALAGNPS